MPPAELSSVELVAVCNRLLDAAHRLLHGPSSPAAAVDLDGASHLLTRVSPLLEDAYSRGADEARTLLVDLREARLAIAEVRLQRRSESSAALHTALARLRTESTVSVLLQQIPVELATLGFSRALLSRLRGRDWGASSAYAHQDVSLAEALVEVGRSVPGKIGREEPETEMVQRRLPIIVRDAQRKPRVHRELVKLTETREYIAAPIVADGTVMGLLHVDRHSQADVLDSFDRDLVGLFAQGAGLALERAHARERFAHLQRRLEGGLADLRDVVAGSGSWDEDDGAAGHERPSPADPRSYPHPPVGPLEELTRREWEVLRHLEAGASNQEIASRLGVSTATVKTHIKHVLRKLGAANRADAAARLRRHIAVS